MTTLQKIIYRASTDPSFRSHLRTDARVAAAEIGVDLDDETLAVLMELSRASAPMQAMAEDPAPDPDWMGSPSLARAAAEPAPDPDWMGSPSLSGAVLS